MDNQYEIERQKKSEQLAKDFSNDVNSSCYDSKYFIEAFKKQHRTLQQKMFGVMLKTMVEIASDDYQVDGRNEQSKKVAKKFIRGYAHEVAEEYLNSCEDRTDSYYINKAEEFKKDIIANPSIYIGLSII